MNIDWSNPEAHISKYFKVKDALSLRNIHVMHIPSEEEKANILKLADTMDQVREIIGKPIIVHCWIRPTSVKCNDITYLGYDYNKSVKGSKSSQHIYGKAVDFHVKGMESARDCMKIRLFTIVPELERLNIRMEDIDGAWIHIDDGDVKRRRFFKP